MNTGGLLALFSRQCLSIVHTINLHLRIETAGAFLLRLSVSNVNVNSHILESIHLFIARILGEVSFNYILCDRYCH